MPAVRVMLFSIFPYPDTGREAPSPRVWGEVKAIEIPRLVLRTIPE